MPGQLNVLSSTQFSQMKIRQLIQYLVQLMIPSCMKDISVSSVNMP